MDDTGAGTDTMTSMTGMTGMTTMSMSTSSTTMDTDATSTGMTTTPEESGSSGGSGGGGAPVINSITWTHAAGCVMNTGSDVEIVIDATDPDNDVAELTFSGMLIGCTGEVDAATSTLLCPQVAPYTGDITVADPDGNEADLEITIEPCVDGSAEA